MSQVEKPYVTASQIRAARGLLNWSQEDLADATGLSVATIRKLEAGNISPRGETTRVIKRAFERARLEFLEFNGLRQRPEEIRIFEGIEGVRAFYEDVYQTACSRGGSIVAVATDPNLYFDMIEDYAKLHHEQMYMIRDKFSARVLIMESAKNMPAPAYCEYRVLSKSYVDSVPFYIYGDKCAIRTLYNDSVPKIVIIQSQLVADSFRHQFDSMWDKATPLNTLENGKSSYTDKPKRKKFRSFI